MSHLIQYIADHWNDYGDKRTSNWFLTKNFYPVISFVGASLIITQFILPKVLKGKKYPQLAPLLALYYLIVGLIGLTFIALQSFIIFAVDPINLRCHPVSQDFIGAHYNYALIVYYWVWFKVIENLEIIFLTIINGAAQPFLVIHHSVLSVLLVIFTHFYAGGSPAIFGMILNVGHTFLYFIIGARTLSEEFRIKSEIWYKKFRVIESIGELIVAIIFFAQVQPRGACNYETFKKASISITSIFLTVTIYLRWSYISQKEAFGETAFVKFCNKIIGIERKKHCRALK